MCKRILAVAASLLVVSVLGWGMAFADAPEALQAGSFAPQSTSISSLSSQTTSKSTIYVLIKRGSDRFSYNKNGLVKKQMGSYETKAYRYKGAKVVSYSNTRSTSSPQQVTVAYDSKGRVKKVKASGASSYDSYIDTYSYNKKGLVTRIAHAYTMMSGSDYTTTYKYTSQGYVKSSTNTNGMKTTHGYDRRGNVTSFSAGPASGFGGMTRYVQNTYTYKNGRIVKRAQTMNGTNGAVYTDAYSYKKMSVPKAYVAQVKKQQRVLLGNANPAVVL